MAARIEKKSAKSDLPQAEVSIQAYKNGNTIRVMPAGVKDARSAVVERGARNVSILFSKDSDGDLVLETILKFLEGTPYHKAAVDNVKELAKKL